MSRYSKNPWVVLVIVCLAQFMVVLDATIVNVALFRIQTGLHFSQADLQWVVNAYTLVFAGFLLLGGRVGDLLGRKRFFMIGLVIFTAASFLNGIATTSGMLIGFRGLQGLGAALISPAALSIISTTFAEGKERSKALGVWAAIAIGGSAFGLVLGGWLTQSFNWRWIFFVNVPVGIIAFIAAWRLVPESKDEHAHKGYDLAGALSVTGGLMLLVYGLVNAAGHGWSSTVSIVSFIVAAALLVGFVFIEQRSAEPLVRLSIFRVRSLTTANLSMFLAFSGMFAMFFFNTQYIQRVLGFDPLEAGLAFLPFTAGIMVSAGLASNFAPRIGVRPVAVVGHAADNRRAAPVLADAGRRLVRVRRPARDAARVPGHGRDLHAADAHRDDRPEGRGPGSRLGPVQHVAAGRRSARARRPHDHRRRAHERPELAVVARDRVAVRVPRRRDLRRR